MSKALRLLRLFPLFIGAVGCSSSIVGESWPNQSWPALDAFTSGDFDRAATEFSQLKGDGASNELLALVESGMARHTGGDLEGATKHWLEAERILENFKDRPTISGRTLGESAASLVINDRALPYDGEDFEIALLHAFLAWNFLRLGDLDSAMVEVRKGYEAEKWAEKQYQAEYSMNRFAKFISALAQEADSAWDDAVIDWEDLVTEMPKNKTLSECLQHARSAQNGTAPQTSIALIHEKGRMPQKVSLNIEYEAERTFGRIVAPAFGKPMPSPSRIELWVDGKPKGKTFVLEDVYKSAKENLADRIAWMAGKSAIRATIKTALIEEAAENVEEEKGFWAGFGVGMLGSLLFYSTEQPDLRSWQTLPQQIQALRVTVEPGKHRLSIRFQSRGETHILDLGEFEIPPGETLLLSARTLRRAALGKAGKAPAVFLGPATLKP